MSNATAKLTGDILSYYSTPVGTAPLINSMANGDQLGQALGMTQTAAGVAQMLGAKIANPVALGIPLTALGADVAKMNESRIADGTVKVGDLYSAAANLSAVAGAVALIGAGTALAVPVAIGVAIGMTATGIALTAASLAEKGEVIDLGGLMDSLKQDIGKIGDALGGAFSDAMGSLSDAIHDLANNLDDAGEWFDDVMDAFGDSIINGALGLGDFLNGIGDAVNDCFNAARDWVRRIDPLVLDLDGDGVETIGANGTVLFDHDGDGNKHASGWIKPDDGLLVLDRNGNGLIDNGAELFGVETVLANGEKATDGFAALASLDSNSDGLFDASDAQYGNVQVWRDLNQNGISETNELKTLAETGVASIDLNAAASSTNLAGGNRMVATGTYTRTDGIIRQAASLDLATGHFWREFGDTVPLTEAAKSLPNMGGSGAVRDLREAASLSPELASAVAGLEGLTRTQALAEMDAILDLWADTRSGFRTSAEMFRLLTHKSVI